MGNKNVVSVQDGLLSSHIEDEILSLGYMDWTGGHSVSENKPGRQISNFVFYVEVEKKIEIIRW